MFMIFLSRLPLEYEQYIFGHNREMTERERNTTGMVFKFSYKILVDKAYLNFLLFKMINFTQNLLKSVPIHKSVEISFIQIFCFIFNIANIRVKAFPKPNYNAT